MEAAGHGQVFRAEVSGVTQPFVAPGLGRLVSADGTQVRPTLVVCDDPQRLELRQWKMGAHMKQRWLAYPCCVAAWIIAGLVLPWPFSRAFRGFPRGVCMNLGSHALCAHESPILSASADYIFTGLLFLPLLIHVFRPRRWLLIIQLAFVAIPLGWWALCYFAWLSGPHP